MILEPAAVLDIAGFMFWDFADWRFSTNGRFSIIAWAKLLRREHHHLG